MKVLIFSLCLFLCIPSAFAQNYGKADPMMDKIQPQAYYANPVFNEKARRAMRHGVNRSFSFTEFRRLYTQTRQYAPISDGVIDRLLQHAFLVQTSQDPQEVKSELENYHNLLLDHLANLQVVLQALSLSKTDKRLGNRKHLDQVRSGLIQNLLQSGNGLTLKDAYDVITMDEEVILFQALGLEQKETVSNREGMISYNMHEVRDHVHKRDIIFFVNTTFPMDFLGKIAEQRKELTFDIRRQ